MPITDLTGYQWVGNDSLDLQNTNQYSINFTCDNVSYNTFAIQFLPFPQEHLELAYNDIVAYYYNMQTGTWDNTSYKTIQITGGTDATNATLIAWLEANGTLTAPIQANTYNLTHTLTNLSKGNITLQITPDTNYTYPTSLTISNGSIVSYDNTTGVAVISGDDTTIVSGECVEQASGYSVSVYSGINDGDILVDVYDGQNNSGIYLGTVSSYQTENYIITSGYIYVEKAPSPLMTPGIVYFDNTGGLNTLPISSDTSLTVTLGMGPGPMPWQD